MAYSANGNLACLNMYTGKKVFEYKTEPGKLLEIVTNNIFLTAAFSNVVRLWDIT